MGLSMMNRLVLLLLALVSTAYGFGAHTPVFGARTSPIPQSSNTMVMRARVCDLLGKRPNRQARVVTFSHIRNKKVQHVNLQWKRYFSETLNRTVRLRISTKGIKTVQKIGNIDKAAKKFEVDLKQF